MVLEYRIAELKWFLSEDVDAVTKLVKILIKRVNNLNNKLVVVRDRLKDSKAQLMLFIMTVEAQA